MPGSRGTNIVIHKSRSERAFEIVERTGSLLLTVAASRDEVACKAKEEPRIRLDQIR